MRPQASSNRRRIHGNTVRIFRSREQLRCLVIIRRSSTVNVGQAPRTILADGMDFGGSEQRQKQELF